MQLDAIGPMTVLILVSLMIGKVLGIYSMYRLAKVFGHFAPLGVRDRHVLMIGLICSVGLIVALLLSEYAFPEAYQAHLQTEAKIGALLSGFISLLCMAISRYYNFESIDDTVEMQLKEEAIIKRQRLLT